jgi:uncharacterized protein YqeY
MTILERLERDMIEATKAHEKERLAAIRFVRSEVRNREIELGRGLTDEDAIEVLSRVAKRHRESIEQFSGAGRDDLASRETHQLAVVETYLPARLTDDELDGMVREAIAESGASSARDLGAVMKALMPRVKGRADGAAVRGMVQSRLAALGEGDSGPDPGSDTEVA